MRIRFYIFLLLSSEKNKFIFCLLLRKIHTKSKNCSESHIKCSVPDFLLSHWLIFSCIRVIGGFWYNIQNHRRHIFKSHRRLPYAPISSLKRVSGRIFRISKWFQRSKQKRYIFYSSKKAAKKLETIGDQIDSTD